MNSAKLATRLEEWLSGYGLGRLRSKCIASPRGRVFGLWYINGPDVLPQPLSREEEAEVICRLESDGEMREAARSVLIERNLRLVAFIARRFENTGIGIEDLISIGTLGLIKAVESFRSDKGIRLATYASRCIENEILMYIRKTSGRQEVSIDEPLNTDWDGNELLLSDVLGSDDVPMDEELEQDEELQALHRAIDRLDVREKLIIELRFGLSGRQEMTQKEVADLLGISQSYISRLEKKILSRLRQELENY